MAYRRIEVNQPSWNTVLVRRKLSGVLAELETLSKNLWWCWNDSARELFKSIDPEAWEAAGENPILMLDRTSIRKFKSLENDSDFLSRLEKVSKEFNEYMALKAERKAPRND